MKEFLKPFDKATYRKRRQDLLDRISKSHDGDFAVLLWSGSELVRNFDAHFAFRATSDFLYFTGFSEPDTLVILLSQQGKYRSLIGLRPRDLSSNRGSEIWEGERVGVERASSLLGFDEAFAIRDSVNLLEKELSRVQNILWTFAQFKEWDEKLIHILAQIDSKNRGLSPIRGILDPRPYMHAFRKR